MSTTPSHSWAVPSFLTALVDDAAVFPPASTPLVEALAAHGQHRAAAYSALVGPLVVGDRMLPDLGRALEDREEPPAVTPLPVTVVCSGGAGALEPAVRWAERLRWVELHSVEVALQDESDLPGNARRVVAAAELAAEVPVYVEPPPLRSEPSHGWLAAVDELAAAELRLKLRCGGSDADSFPSSEAVAAFVEAALDRETPFKCTAGLHGAVRNQDRTTGFQHHGFLNVVLATRAALDGDDVVAVLEERDPTAIVARLEEVGDDALYRARRWFTSFGCCAVGDPVDDLVRLGVLAP